MSFLRALYEDDPLIANLRVLQLIKLNFPETHATQEAVYVWKTELRQQGVDIPLQRDRA